jgi:radical SAM superfamily enzyme YgiQ (UPF0313 family)
VGFESGDPQILKNIKKGTTVEMARTFAKNCKKVGIVIHGDFVLGLPGETKESIERTIAFAQELDTQTIQVSVAQAFPGTELYDYAARNNFLASEAVADAGGYQLPHLEYPDLGRIEMMAAMNRFYDSYYFRPRVVWRIVREALWKADERRRLYHEAIAYLRVRAERQKYARGNSPQPSRVVASRTRPGSHTA